MKRAMTFGLYLGLALGVFGLVRWMSHDRHALNRQGTHEDYHEECQSEGCSGEEVSELFESYQEECNGEVCDTEEVKEIAGGAGSVNAMLNDFQSRGFPVKPCSFIPPKVPAGLNNLGTGDLDLVGGWCNQPMVNTLWGDFHMSQGNWDDGWGFQAACNVNLPLGRTFNALALLRLFGTSGQTNTNFLPFFYPFSSNAIDELEARCGGGNLTGSITLATTFTGAQDNRTELYWGYFYALDVAGRAGTIVHEARHADGGPSHNCNTCSAGSCDSNWNLWGSRSYEVDYLWWLRATGGAKITNAMSILAKNRANGVLSSAFCKRPTRADVFGAGVSNPNAFHTIP